MAHLGFEGVLPPAEAAPEVDAVADSVQDVSLAQEPAPRPALPEDGGEDFFNEESETLCCIFTFWIH